MTINGRVLRYLAQHPRAHSQFQASGLLPELRQVSSPLIALLESMEPARRRLYQGVIVGPRLGYKNIQRAFTDAQELLSFLKPFPEALPNDWCPGLDLQLGGQAASLGEADLAACCRKHPPPR